MEEDAGGIFEGGFNRSIELHKAGVWGCSPQPLSNWKHFNYSKLTRLLYISM